MIGFDMGSKFLKIAKVIQKGKGKFIIDAAMTSFELEKSAARNQKGAAVQGYNLSGKAKALMKRLKDKNEKFYLSFNGNSVVARDFTVPKLSGTDLAGAVKLEAEHLMFEDIDTMYTDYTVLSQSGSDKLDVLFVAAPRKEALNKLNLFLQAGLQVAGFTIDNVALVNAFLALEPERAKNETVILLNIGHAITNVAVVSNGSLKFVRNVAFGGQDISREIALSYSVTDSIAEQIKRQSEIWADLGLNVKNILKKSSPNLLEAVFRSMEHSMTRQKIVAVDSILITGGGACLKGIDTFIHDVLGIKSEKWNPLQSASVVNASSAFDIEQGFLLPVSIGLALQKGGSANV